MSEPERIDEATVVAALDALVQNAAVGDATFSKLVAAAGKELNRRFEEDPGSLPGTFVIKLFLDGQKLLASGDAPDEEAPPPDPDVLELAQNPGLPVERKRELLEQEAVRVRDRLADIDEALEALTDE